MMDPFQRYSRQICFGKMGQAGQANLAKSRVLIVGVGALGTVTAEILARAGVGTIQLVDRDFVELSNLQRQSLFCEADALAGTPKAVAAAKRLSEINSQMVVNATVADLTPDNISRFGRNIDLILDGTDNFETRFLINDFSIREGIPWIYCGCLGADGQTMNMVPTRDPCLRCLIPGGPPPGLATCDTVGVLGPTIHVLSAIQSLEALKFLSGNSDSMVRGLQIFSLWDARNRTLAVKTNQKGLGCPTCQQRQFDWLEGGRFTRTVKLCGRNSVQVTPGTEMRLDLEMLEKRLAHSGLADDICRNAFLCRFGVEGKRFTVFCDGRAIVEGTDDFSLARTLYSRFIG